MAAPVTRTHIPDAGLCSLSIDHRFQNPNCPEVESRIDYPLLLNVG